MLLWLSGWLIEENRFITITPETEVLKEKQLMIDRVFEYIRVHAKKLEMLSLAFPGDNHLDLHYILSGVRASASWRLETTPLAMTARSLWMPDCSVSFEACKLLASSEVARAQNCAWPLSQPQPVSLLEAVILLAVALDSNSVLLIEIAAGPWLSIMVAREKNQDKSSEEMEGKLSQIQEQLQKLMEGMVNINDRNVQTDKELMEIKQALGNVKQKDKEMNQNRAESSVGGDR
ncbi:hypothetical protein KY290_027118 [Solanum tuberosum]|uniref:Uncharacterized protein n=1 Tax=Solanum tuberosum TaxID=4113 RepID=A0ABQ7UE15_SOLTU|nr:hypothetical protein KY290_027118 [Solanum tuberosum]